MRHAGISRIRVGMRQEMRENTVSSAINWPVWFGISLTIAVAVAMAVLGISTFHEGAAPANHAALNEAMQLSLRSAFLLISLGALSRLPSPMSAQWRWAAGAALAVLFCGVVADVAIALARTGWIMDFRAGLGAYDNLERRLFRLGAMAAYAIPMLALLAAGEHKEEPITKKTQLSSRIAAILVRWEPLLFTIGVSALASFLIAAAFINRELAWLSPIGADTAFAACAAATIRARRRTDSLAFAGWLLVCAGMTVGLLIGSYSFGGPVPTPDFIGDYNAIPRALLRGGHVILISIGIVGIALAAARKPQEGLL